MVLLQTASRLHFGLFHLVAEGTRWPLHDGHASLPARRFGGVGLMVERPGIRVRVERAETWSASGPHSERALRFARQFAGAASPSQASVPCRIVVEEAPAEHVGLGTGTQLGLAIGRCLAAEWGLQLSVVEIARGVGRGQRSALGIHGFEHGGFLVEAGRSAACAIAPLVVQRSFPRDWRIVLARPRATTGTHGTEEQLAIRSLESAPETVNILSRLVVLGMLPALAEEDIDAFGDAVYDFNARAGEVFAPYQAGTYSTQAAAELVRFLRNSGIRGVGQSSWGPTIFAVVECEDAARHAARRIETRFPESTEVLVTVACNDGARLSAPPGPA